MAEGGRQLPDRSGGEIPRSGVILLLAAIFTAAACAIVYELLLGTTSSYFLGDSIAQFSLTIGFFLFAMGVGSWVSRLIERRLLERFILLEIGLGLVGGLAVPILYAAYAYTDHYRYCMLLLIVGIGGLIGLEVPLLTRILRGYGSLRTILADVLSFDYLGSLVAALLFPYLLLPLLGTLHTSLVTGLVNTAVALALLLYFGQHMGRARSWLAAQGVVVFACLAAMLWAAEPLRERWESALYEDRIVFSTQSAYQRIVLTEWHGDLRLFLNGHLQFASVDEYRYHEALVHPAMALSSSRQRVLIIGGGDGLSAREVLKYPEVLEIDLVDMDRAMTDLARRDLRIARLNKNALSHPKVRILNEDGFTFLQQPHEAYGVIVVDLPDPRVAGLSKLYSVEGYRLFKRHLSPGGLLVTQATSPYFAREAYWSIAATLETAGFVLFPYHVLVPSFGEWGFHLAGEGELPIAEVEFDIPLRFLRAELLPSMGVFPSDMERLQVGANRLDSPLLSRYYREGWGRW